MTQTKRSRALRLFYSYAHADLESLLELETHLALLKRRGIITTWFDRRIDAGATWQDEIEEQLSSDDVILLLITPDFIASDYCYNVEMPRAIARHRRKEEHWKLAGSLISRTTNFPLPSLGDARKAHHQRLASMFGDSVFDWMPEPI